MVELVLVTWTDLGALISERLSDRGKQKEKAYYEQHIIEKEIHNTI